MKRTVTTFALAAILAGTSHAAISGKKPDFMDKQQLAALRAEVASNTIKETGGSSFFTGKPYVASNDGYAFKFRSYSPRIARWTSDDPSGFPDGTNNSHYAPVPTTQLDWCGLLSINLGSGVAGQATNSGVTMNGLWMTATTTKGNTVEVFRMTSVINQPANPPIPGIMHDFTHNCHGYVFLPGYWIDNGQVATILADEWTLTTDQSKAKIVVYGAQDHSANVSSYDSNGNVENVTGKNGYTGVVTLGVNGTGFTNPKFYE